MTVCCTGRHALAATVDFNDPEQDYVAENISIASNDSTAAINAKNVILSGTAPSQYGVYLNTETTGGGTIAGVKNILSIHAADTIGVTTLQGAALHVEGSYRFDGDAENIMEGVSLVLNARNISLTGGWASGGHYTDNIAVYSAKKAAVLITDGNAGGGTLTVRAAEQHNDTSLFPGHNTSLYAWQGGTIAVAFGNHSRLDFSGGLVAYGDNTQVDISTGTGSSAVIDGNLVAIEGQVRIDTTSSNRITAPLIMTQSGRLISASARKRRHKADSPVSLAVWFPLMATTVMAAVLSICIFRAKTMFSQALPK